MKQLTNQYIPISIVVLVILNIYRNSTVENRFYFMTNSRYLFTLRYLFYKHIFHSYRSLVND